MVIVSPALAGLQSVPGTTGPTIVAVLPNTITACPEPVCLAVKMAGDCGAMPMVRISLEPAGLVT
jgi:hypothetical protein